LMTVDSTALKVSQQREIFRDKNWGWFPYFDHNGIHHFSFNGYQKVLNGDAAGRLTPDDAVAVYNNKRRSHSGGLVPNSDSVVARELCARFCDSSEAAVLRAQNGSTAQRTNADDSLTVNSREAVIRTTPFAGQTRTKCTATSPSIGPVGGDETHEFFGDCDTGGGAMTGLVISAYKGVAVYPRCLNNRQYSNLIGEFDACSRARARLPRYCSIGTYRGECENSVLNGVGVDHKITYTRTEVSGALGMFSGMARPQEAHEIARGMFKDGKLDGFGNFFSISGCGLAGCSGGRVNQTGGSRKDS
jgi:hypothetical protein